MSDALVERCREALVFPDGASAKLYEQAKNRQWRIDADIDWRELDLRKLAPSVRSAMATVYSQVRFAEMFELVHAAKLLAQSEEPWVRMMVATQVADESRHVEFFSRTIASLDMDAEPSPHLVAFCRELDQTVAAEEGFLGSQIILESYAHALFQDAARLARLARNRAISLPGSEAALRFVDCMTKFIAGDEARHVAFGVLHLRARWPALTPPQCERLRRLAADWSALLDAVLRDIAPALTAIGLSSSSLICRAGELRRRHLLAIGLTSPPSVRSMTTAVHEDFNDLGPRKQRLGQLG
jgi:hypothetical protein